MNQLLISLPEIKLVGITTRTSNKLLFEGDPETNQVAETVKNYFHNDLAKKIPNRNKIGTTYCAYTDYESDHTGEFTYLIGESVSSFDGISDEFTCLTIPAASYIQLTNGPAPMPKVCIDMWEKIWRSTPEELGGTRAYTTDFEIYDDRSLDHMNVTLDLCIAIKS
jgi:predicted transcriptional regulator YdeE